METQPNGILLLKDTRKTQWVDLIANYRVEDKITELEENSEETADRLTKRLKDDKWKKLRR